MVTDGGYVGTTVDQTMREQEVEHITTGLTGSLPDHAEGKLAFSDFAMQLDPQGRVTHAICPAGHPATICPSTQGKSSRLLFDPEKCQACTFFQQAQCPVKTRKKKSTVFLSVPKDRAFSSQRRRRFEQCKAEARNLRPAVEGTVYQIKHKLRGGKWRVRGLFRIDWAFAWAALAANLRRIYRYENDRQRGKNTSKKGREAFASAIFLPLIVRIKPLLHLRFGTNTCFGF
jgi:hypothetical protein